MIRLLLSLISLILLLPLILCGVLAAVVYFNYIKVQPAEYSLAQDVSQIESIEYAQFVFGENGLSPKKAGIIEDKEGFVNALQTIECHSGITGTGFNAIVNGEPIEGVIINYTDGTHEYITPYICVNPSFNPQSITDVLGARVYGFDKDAFSGLIDTYGVGVTQDDVNNFEDILNKIPELLPQN